MSTTRGVESVVLDSLRFHSSASRRTTSDKVSAFMLSLISAKLLIVRFDSRRLSGLFSGPGFRVIAHTPLDTPRKTTRPTTPRWLATSIRCVAGCSLNRPHVLLSVPAMWTNTIRLIQFVRHRFRHLPQRTCECVPNRRTAHRVSSPRHFVCDLLVCHHHWCVPRSS